MKKRYRKGKSKKGTGDADWRCYGTCDRFAPLISSLMSRFNARYLAT